MRQRNEFQKKIIQNLRPGILIFNLTLEWRSIDLNHTFNKNNMPEQNVKGHWVTSLKLTLMRKNNHSKPLSQNLAKKLILVIKPT